MCGFVEVCNRGVGHNCIMRNFIICTKSVSDNAVLQ